MDYKNTGSPHTPRIFNMHIPSTASSLNDLFPQIQDPLHPHTNIAESIIFNHLL